MWLDLKWYEAWMTRSYVEEDINLNDSCVVAMTSQSSQN